jgi:hypothetical protein
VLALLLPETLGARLPDTVQELEDLWGSRAFLASGHGWEPWALRIAILVNTSLQTSSSMDLTDGHNKDMKSVHLGETKWLLNTCQTHYISHYTNVNWPSIQIYPSAAYSKIFRHVNMQ